MHIHILGICGTFMGGLAALAREAGHRVTGCDAGVYPPMSDQLRALGIELIEGFDIKQMALQPDMFVVGNVVSRARLSDGTSKFPLMYWRWQVPMARQPPLPCWRGSWIAQVCSPAFW
jgi:UDP-N-acetylmuramate: L-alanyl-gamma-D-glutamyl-meso-diaminopimelate ligase